MKKSIVWFKSDLRLHDNETLITAINQSDEIIPIYCLDEKHFGEGDFGFKKMNYFRFKFLIESLQNLDENLRKIGSGLLLLKGKPEIEIPLIVKKYGVTHVYSKKEVAFEEKQTEKAVELEIWKLHCKLETLSTSTLYHAEDLPFSIKDIPDVFTNFRKKIEKESTIRAAFEAPQKINSPYIEALKLPSSIDFNLKPKDFDHRAVLNFKGGESEALKRVYHYLHESKLISSYKETRNQLIGSEYSSKFSAWLSNGCLSPREIYHEIKKYEKQNGANDSTYWLEFELLWRDYFRFMMKKYSEKYFLLNGIKSIEIKNTSKKSKDLDKWINGQTNVDFIDANMNELRKTGFMSNRGRQNVASYLCHNLNLDWRFGAAYFEQELIDYDVCSNWGNWAYIAGVGNDPRENRSFNIEKQANDYDKKYSYRNLWLNEKK